MLSIVKKYLFYKRALQTLLAVNVFFILLGCIAGVQYFKTHDLSSLEMLIIGVGIFIFGFCLPLFLTVRLTSVINDMRRQTEEAAARWISGWLENYHKTDDPIHDPYFWLNIALMSAEVFGKNSKHPVARFISEFAPLLKAELQKPSSRKAHKSRKSSV